MNAGTGDQSFTGEPIGAGGKACPYCGTALSKDAPYCWKCGREQPGVLEYVEAATPLDDESLMAAELERGNREAWSPKGILRSGCAAFPVTVVLLFTVIYLLGGWRDVTLPAGLLSLRAPNTGDRLVSAEDAGQAVAILTLGVLFFFAVVALLREISSRKAVNAILLSVIAVLVVLLIFDVIMVTAIPALRPLTLLAIVAAFGVLQWTKLGRKRPGQSK